MRYYFDTSIWLDIWENRDEANLPKGSNARKLLKRIIQSNEEIVYSDIVVSELVENGYSFWEVEHIFASMSLILVYIEQSEKIFRKSRDLAMKRGIPIKDALHALLARSSKSIIISRETRRCLTDSVLLFKALYH